MDGKWSAEDFGRAISTGIESVAGRLEADATAPPADAPEGTECTHSWKTCPVHGTGTGELPPMNRVVSCLYGGMPTKDGGTWNDQTSAEVTKQVAAKLRRLL